MPGGGLSRARVGAVALVLGLFSSPALAACPETPFTLASLDFSGNRVTQAFTMQRELTLRPGQPYPAAALAGARQALLDLGLFRAVELECTGPASALALRITVAEKFYLLPAPRLDGNSDREAAYGLHLSWHNVAGLNRTVRATVLQRESRATGRGQSLEYRISYDQPFIGHSPYGYALFFGHDLSQLDSGGQRFAEISDTARLELYRAVGGSTPTQGLRISATAEWRDERADADSGPHFGQALSLGLGARWRDRRDFVYSEAGLDAGLRVDRAQEGFLADYDQTRITAWLDHARPWGVGQHQSLDWRLELGVRSEGPRDGLNEYSLGGASRLRGYDKNVAEGDAYALIRAEALRSVGWPWLRGGVFGDLGGAWGGADRHNPGVLASAGLMLQIRPPWFVGLVINLGVGWPLVEVDQDRDPTFFGDGR